MCRDVYCRMALRQVMTPPTVRAAAMYSLIELAPMPSRSTMQHSGFDAKLPQILPCSKVVVCSTNSLPNSFRHRKDLRKLYFGERGTCICRILCTELEAMELHLRLNCILHRRRLSARGWRRMVCSSLISAFEKSNEKCGNCEGDLDPLIRALYVPILYSNGGSPN